MWWEPGLVQGKAGVWLWLHFSFYVLFCTKYLYTYLCIYLLKASSIQHLTLPQMTLPDMETSPVCSPPGPNSVLGLLSWYNPWLTNVLLVGGYFFEQDTLNHKVKRGRKNFGLKDVPSALAVQVLDDIGIFFLLSFQALVYLDFGVHCGRTFSGFL